LVQRDMDAMQWVVYRCAQLHLEHIATSGDPFELGSSRPLDFGHWAAHKLEQLTTYELRHGEAVAIGQEFNQDATNRRYQYSLVNHPFGRRIYSQLESFCGAGADGAD